jgi:hypothetical protein
MNQSITPTSNDILCGRRGKTSHRGNRRFRAVIATHMPKYANPNTTWKQKTLIVQSIVEEMHHEGCRFLKQKANTNLWHDVDHHNAKIKVGRALRDAKTKMTRFLSQAEVPQSNQARSSTTTHAHRASPAPVEPTTNRIHSNATKSSSSPSVGDDLKTDSWSDSGDSDNGQLFTSTELFNYADIEPIGLAHIPFTSQHQGMAQPTNGRPDTVASCAFDTKDDEDLFSCWIQHITRAERPTIKLYERP